MIILVKYGACMSSDVYVALLMKTSCIYPTQFLPSVYSVYIVLWRFAASSLALALAISPNRKPPAAPPSSLQVTLQCICDSVSTVSLPTKCVVLWKFASSSLALALAFSPNPKPPAAPPSSLQATLLYNYL